MDGKTKKLIAIVLLLVGSGICQARIKLVALPERADTVIRLDNPQATLIEEERLLTLQKGANKVDFSWKGVNIDADSIRLKILDHPDKIKLLNVSYPPKEAALVWQIACDSDYVEKVRISYLLYNIDRLITYKAIADKAETAVNLSSFLVLRNFSGEDFERALVKLDYGEAFEQGIKHEETKQMLFLKVDKVPIEKVWTFDAAKLPWEPEKEEENVGIPVSYRIKNSGQSKLGKFALWGGKVRIFQDDGHKTTIFLGEDVTSRVPVGEKMELYVGDSRDIVVTQLKKEEKMVNQKYNKPRYNERERIVLHDMDEEIYVKIENFKDTPAVLTLIEHIPGEWDMKKCTLDKKSLKESTAGREECNFDTHYLRKNANTIEFEIKLDKRREEGPATREITMRYRRNNIRP